MLTDGTYLVSSLANLAFSFTVGGASFTIADMNSFYAPSVAVTIYQSGTDFFFNGPQVLQSGQGGAVDFENQNGVVSFEATHVGNDFPPRNTWRLFRYGVNGGDRILGTYGVTPSPLEPVPEPHRAVPEPSALALLGIGLAAFGVSRRRLRG